MQSATYIIYQGLSIQPPTTCYNRHKYYNKLIINLYLAISHYIMFCRVTSYNVMIYHIILWYTIVYAVAIACYSMLYHMALYYILPWPHTLLKCIESPCCFSTGA